MVTEVRKILGKKRPVAAGTPEDLYGPPVDSEAVTSTLTITNVTEDISKARIYVLQSGDVADLDNALYYDLPITGNDTFAATVGLALKAGEKIMVESEIGGALNFMAFGVEINL